MLRFKPTFSLYSFTFIKRIFSSSSLSAIRVVSYAYLKLLIFLPEILIPVCASCSPAFLMMYSAYKLNKQGEMYSLDILLSQFGTSLSDFTFTFHFPASEKAMATHSSVLAWRIPGMGEPGILAVSGVAQSWTRLKRLSSSRTGHGTTDCLQIGKGVCQGCILSPWLVNLYAEYE